MTDPSSKISWSLDYSRHEGVSPSYRMNKISAREGSSSVTITTAGGQVSNFDIPERCVNLSKSVLSFSLTPEATAASVNYMRMDCLSPIAQIQLFTRAGVMLCDVNELGDYTNMV